VTPKVNHRLPDALYPTRYDIVIKPYFRVTERPENYDGSVSITFRASRDTNKLVLHARQLEIVNTTLQLSSTTDTQFAAWNGFSWTYDSVTSLLTVDLGNTRTFRSGFLYVFKTDFKGKSLSDNLGIYRTSYMDNGQTHWLLTTQMEYIEARKSFPCFDEPGYRSVFHITIVHDNSLTLVKSNMPVKSKTTL
jgi:aminopeptidase 2